MSRVNLVLSSIALVLFWSSSVCAQVKDAFLEGVADFVNAANGLSGDERPALTAAIEAKAAEMFSAKDFNRTQWLQHDFS